MIRQDVGWSKPRLRQLLQAKMFVFVPTPQATSPAAFLAFPFLGVGVQALACKKTG
jgi:hypothetical protein